MRKPESQAGMKLSLRVLSRLLSYPDTELRRHLPEMREALASERAIAAGRREEIDALMRKLERSSALDAEASYVELFDRGRATSLHLFEHVHGDSRDRGPAMIDLGQTYAKAGLNLGPNELPDYLPAMLEFLSTQPQTEARAFLAELVHILNSIFSALQQRQSAYASLLGALIELAGEKAQSVKVIPDEALDESWQEPLAFDGCSVNGQSKPGQPQPMHFVRQPPSSPGART